MYIAHITISVLAAIANTYAAILDFKKDPKIVISMQKLSTPLKWLPVLGGLKALAVVGIIAGIFNPVLSIITASSLILFFVTALFFHLKAGDRSIGPAIIFLLLAVALLVVSINQ